jgi:hypothetical protein
MNAQTHFEKAERLASAQTKLDPATDWESIVEGCYMAAYNLRPGRRGMVGRPAQAEPHAQAEREYSASGQRPTGSARGVGSARNEARGQRVWGQDEWRNQCGGEKTLADYP